MKEPRPRVVVLDAGAQYVDMIKKASERQGFPTEILPIDSPFEKLPKSVEAVIVSGGPSSSHSEGAPMPDKKLWQQNGIPTFNICYGMQAFALSSGGRISTRGYRADGRHTTQLDTSHPLFTKVRHDSQALFTHGDFVDNIPSDIKVIGQHTAQNGEQIISALARGPHVCVQFHPEITDDTPQGFEMFGNFFKYIAKIQPDPKFLKDFQQRLIKRKQELIKKRVGDKHMIAFVSGGVDSVTAVMLAKNVVPQDRLHMYYIDNGYMRVEDDTVIKELAQAGLNVYKIDATKEFEHATSIMDGVNVGPLVKTTNPMHKRRIIGEAFIDVQDRIVAELGLTQDDVVLLQGTNAADRIESGHSKGGGKTEQIKEHHNQVKRARDLNPIEPLDDLFKKEIRELAMTLGLPEHIAYRQTFPGPGLAVRILGLDKDGFTMHDEKVAASLNGAIAKLNKTHDAQLSAQLLPVRSVGVGGDSRSHIQAVALEGEVDNTALAAISASLTNDFRSLVNRVVYKLGGPSIANLVPIETHATREARETLRRADAIAMEEMRIQNIGRKIEQFPIVLLPLGTKNNRSIVLRPLYTQDYLTAQALLPEVHLPESFFRSTCKRILAEVAGVSHVFIDLTSKPPGTIEWE